MRLNIVVLLHLVLAIWAQWIHWWKFAGLSLNSGFLGASKCSIKEIVIASLISFQIILTQLKIFTLNYPFL